MSINSVTGTNAYTFVQNAINNANNSSSTSGTSSASGSGAFGDMVADSIKSTLSSLRGAESTSAAAISGKATLTDVATAVNGADIALKSVVAIRDKVINAYQDIIKMPM